MIFALAKWLELVDAFDDSDTVAHKVFRRGCSVNYHSTVLQPLQRVLLSPAHSQVAGLPEPLKLQLRESIVRHFLILSKVLL